MVIPSDLHAVRQVEDAILAEACRFGYNESARFAVKLALEEGLNNAIKHGNRCDPAKTVEVTYQVDASSIWIEIVDQGCGFAPQNVPDPTLDENLEKPSGRGIMLMRAYMDEVRYSPAGNQVYMLKRNG